jgi:pSer/pThr/pTyr-binding forkhead associated (FHA) protein
MTIDHTIRLNVTWNGFERAGTAGTYPRITLSPGTSKRIGRSAAADVVVNDKSVSRIHARIMMDPDGQIAVDDLGSTNGVFVNGTQEHSAYLAVRDIVSFGNVEYVVGDGCLEAKVS